MEKYPLKSGLTTTDRRLDRVYQLDWRSLDYVISDKLASRGLPIYQPRSYTNSVDIWLDQGPDGACVAFSLFHELAARPARVLGLDELLAREAYFLIQKRDEWPGGAYPGAVPFYEGTSVLAGTKFLHDAGFYHGYSWGITLLDCMIGAAYHGPFVAGTDWHSGMFDIDQDGFLNPTGYIAGGHAYLVYGIKIVYKSKVTWKTRTWSDVDLDRSYFLIWNSWGKSWGQMGTAKMSCRNFEILLNRQGDAMFPQRNPELLHFDPAMLDTAA